jgi:hypothetical protein
MENKTNSEIRQFTDKITEVINNSGLPIEVKRLALFMVYTEVQRVADNEVSKETAPLVETETLPPETKTYTLDLKEGESKCAEE